MSLLSRPLQSARRRSPPCTTIVRDVGDAVRTQCSGLSTSLFVQRATDYPNSLHVHTWCRDSTKVALDACSLAGQDPAQHLDIRAARGTLLRMRISSMYVCLYVCIYVSVTLRNPIISRATRKRSITCASVTLRNVTAEPAIEVRGEKSSAYNYSAGRRRRCTHTTQWRPA